MELAKQYKEVLSQKYNSEVAVFDYAADFDKFWHSSDLFTPAPYIANKAEDSEYKALIILWDGMPDDGNPISKPLVPHLTPLDWVLAFTIQKLILGEKTGVNFSIHIVDFTVKAYENAYASLIHGTLLDELPWLNLYAPLVPSNAPYRKRYVYLDNLMGNYAIQELGYAVTMATALCDRESEVLERLKNVADLWRSSVLQSDDHHDLNNIVAPILMPIMMGRDDLSPERLSVIMVAFLHRLKWCGLFDWKTVKLSDAEFSSSLDIVAIDDQLAMGWDGVLGALVGISPENVKAMPDSDQIEVLGSISSINLYGATNPNCLLKDLGITQDAGTVKVDINLYKRRKFDSPKPLDSNSRPWMLVLDMRLFSGKISEEQAWYGTLASAAIRIAEECKGELAWSGFDESEQIQHLANGGALDEAHTDTALSLFARLCALRWPSVPIIVFSATGRRGLTAKLAEYGNIFLSSQKPNVLAGNQGEQVAAFMESWARELQAALSLINVQSSLLKLTRANNSVGKNNSTQTSPHKHIIMALDEAGDFTVDPQSAIGGVMLVAEGTSKEDAIKNAYVFQESLRKEGINFYEQPPYYTDASMPGNHVAAFIKKKTDISAMLKKVKNVSRGITLSSFRYVIPMQGYTTNAYKDEAYLRGLTRCIEIATCEMLPSLGVDWTNNVTISAWFPTKQTGFEDSSVQTGVDAASQAAMAYDFRLERFGSSRVEALGGFGKAYSIFLTAIGERREFIKIMKAIVSLKARKIPYADDDGRFSPANDWYCKDCNIVERRVPPKAKGLAANCNMHQKSVTIADYSVMSHLADAIINKNKSPNDGYYKNELNAAYSFNVIENVKLNDFLHTARLFDQEREIDGFKLAYKYDSFIEGINEKGSGALAPIERRLIQKLNEFAPDLKGTTLTELAGIRTRGFGVTTMGVAANQNHQKRNKHKPQNAGTQQVGGQAAAKPSNQGEQLPQAKNILGVRIKNFTDESVCKAVLTQVLQRVDKKIIIRSPKHNSGKSCLVFKTPIENEIAVREAIASIDEFKQGKWHFDFKMM
jgi:hypothetical protein